MARYLGPTCKLSRREGTDLMLKSRGRALDSKCKLDTPPGQHASKRARPTDYALQLRAKQKLKRLYGLLEKQFRNCYKKAAKQKGATGRNLVVFLESRLDNVVYRMGFAPTRAQARQLVSHKAILVNGRVVNTPSFLVKKGDVVEIRESARKQERVLESLKSAKQLPGVDWVEVKLESFQGTFTNYPELTDLPPDYNLHLVIALYSK